MPALISHPLVSLDFSIANQPERGIYAASPFKSPQACRFINFVGHSSGMNP
jgi:hypothetical protein